MTQLGTKKSRGGCNRCKKRHVKCDEEAPCSNCVRRQEQCSLTVVSPSSASEIRERDGSLPVSAEEYMQDMELMHHYSGYVARSQLGVRPQLMHLWQDTIPNEALRHPFLLHGLLALAALSLAYLRPAEAIKYLGLCDRHQSIALSGYRTALSGEIDQDVSTALFALASTLSVSSMARSCATVMTMPPPQVMNMDDVTELFRLTRGVRDVISVAHDYIAQGPLSEMFWGHSMPASAEAGVVLPQSVRAQFGRLEEMLHEQCVDSPKTLAICAATLETLIDIYRNLRYFMQRDDVETGRVWRWTTMVPVEYTRLIQARHPAALVILAYFAAATMAVRTVWYTKDWGVYCLRGVGAALEEEMQGWLSWPWEQVRSELNAVKS